MTSDEAVARVTRNFAQWQGLRWVPVGLSSLIAAVVLAGLPDGGPLFSSLIVASLIVIVGDAWIGDYYDRTFGQVRERRARRAGQAMARAVVVVALVVAGLADDRLQLPVLLTGVLAAGFMVLFWSATGLERWHWPVLAAVVGLTAFLPAAGLTDAGRPSLAVLLALAGAAELIGGILDHRALVARLRAVRRDLDE